MKKEKLIKLFKFLLCIIFTLVSVHLIYDHYNVKKPKPENYLEVKEEHKSKNTIKALQEEYNNYDINAYLEIPDVIGEPVVQSADNTYYFTHNLKKEESEYGTLFIDSRTKINDNILIIYGDLKHTDPDYQIFNKILDREFYTFNKIIDLYTTKKKMSYEFFAAFTEEEDLDYYNTSSYGNISYEEYLNKLKAKSIYKTEVELNSESKILILKLKEQSDEDNKESAKYTLLMGVLK